MHPATRIHFGLTLDPFESNRDPRFFFEHGAHREALARLSYLVEDGNMMVGLLTGAIGCGKTITATTLLSRLRAAARPVVYLPFSDLDFDGVLAEAIEQLGGAVLPERQQRLRTLRELIGDSASGLTVLIDEAQQIDVNVLDRLRALTNVGSTERNALTVVLIGQPDLERHVAALPQLAQRVSLRFHLDAFDAAGTAAYVAHRTRVAGHPTGELFSVAGVQQLHAISAGVPRQINRAAKLCLDLAAAAKIEIDDALGRIANDQGWNDQGWARESGLRP